MIQLEDLKFKIKKIVKFMQKNNKKKRRLTCTTSGAAENEI